MQLLRQLYLGKVDMELHHVYKTGVAVDDEDVFAVQRRVAESGFALLPPLPNDRFLCKFLHIFAGSYDAGYYSYLWSEVSCLRVPMCTLRLLISVHFR